MAHDDLTTTFADDNFDPFDGDKWVLSGSATAVSSAVRLTEAASNKTGRVTLRERVDENIWDAKFTFRIENASSTGGVDLSFGFLAQGLSGDTPKDGYRVIFNHETDTISLVEYVNGTSETLDSSPIAISEERHTATVSYTRGEVEVSLDNTRVLEHEIDDPLGGKRFYVAASTGSNYARHLLDDIRFVGPSRRNVQTARSEWENGGIDVAEGTNTYALLRALTSVADRQDLELSEVYRAHHINTAKGKALDRFGDLVQLDRKSGEGDDKYRARLKVQFRVGNIGTTFDEFSQFTAALLDTDIDNIDFVTDLKADPATARVSADTSVYDQTPLTRAEVASFLGEAVPAGHEVNAVESGTFRLKSDGDTDDADKGLTSDAISTGGTLASDII